MTLPKQVQAAAARSDELLKQQNTTPSVNTPAADAGTQDTTATASAAAGKNWETLYRVLQGKYDAEVPRMAGEIAGLKEEKRQLEERVKALEGARAPEDGGGANTSELISQEDRERFDPALLDLVGSIAKRAAKEEVDPIRANVQETSAERETRSRMEQEQKARHGFAEALEDLVPSWSEVDSLPLFHAYLAETDANTGKQRQQVLMDAVKKFDVVTAARIFNAFIRANPSAVSAPAATPAPSGLESQLVPDNTGGTRIPQDKKIWTTAEIKAFYNDVTKGRYASDPKRAVEIEAEIVAATREGRVRQ